MHAHDQYTELKTIWFDLTEQQSVSSMIKFAMGRGRLLTSAARRNQRLDKSGEKFALRPNSELGVDVAAMDADSAL